MPRKHPRYILEQDTMFRCDDGSRRDRLLEERRRTGVSPDECWSLDYSLACFMVPRLEVFIRGARSFPCRMGSLGKWKAALRKMLYAFRKMRSQDVPWKEGQDARFDEGLRLFREYMLSLWW